MGVYVYVCENKRIEQDTSFLTLYVGTTYSRYGGVSGGTGGVAGGEVSDSENTGSAIMTVCATRGGGDGKLVDGIDGLGD